MRHGRWTVWAVVLWMSSACGDDGGGAGTGDGGAGTGDGGTQDSSSTSFDASGDGGPIVRQEGGVIITEDGGETYTCYPVACAGHVLECGDCMNNDDDGVVDARDPECLGPCDNTEGPELITGVGGETGGPCRADCYFDFGNGPGYDDCRWDHRCDPLSVEPNYHPEGESCAYEEDRVGTRDCPAEQSNTCGQVCPPLTPNGCDCFGCCTFDAIADRPDSEGGAFVWLGSVFDGTNDGSCTLDDLGDTSLCRPCTPVDACFNDCGRCELCIGRSILPEECNPPPPPPDGGTPDAGTPEDGGYTPPPARCAEGVQPCGLEGDEPCPMDFYCITGCCQPTLI